MDYEAILDSKTKKMLLLGAVEDQRTAIIEYIRLSETGDTVSLLEDIYLTLKEVLEKHDVDSKIGGETV